MVHENVVRRSVNLETGQEEIEVVAAGEVAVERFSKRPARNRTVQSGNVLSRRTHGAESARNTGSAGRNYTRSCVQESRRRRALAVQSGVSRPAPCVIGQVGLEKRRDVAPRDENTLPNPSPPSEVVSQCQAISRSDGESRRAFF